MDQLLFSELGKEPIKLAMQIIESSNDSIIISESRLNDGLEPRIIYANDAFIRESGYTKDEVIGKSWLILCGPKTSKSALKRVKNSIEQRYQACEKILHYRKNDDEYWQALNIIPIRNKVWEGILFAAVKNNLNPQKMTKRARSEFKYTLKLLSKANDFLASS